ncbi:MAG: aminopeptidase P family protein [Gemmatimonadetes bacterium]|nr:aminopeptidase P family protein [Gemmatimonadota bacterium]
MADNTGGDSFGRLRAQLPEIQVALRELGLDGWLLYDLHARNPVAGGLLGLGDLTRRYFVLLPAAGEPRAVVHGIEEAPWRSWPWSRQRYIGWRELDEALRGLFGGAGRVAMEISPGDSVPALDLVPAGVLELVRAAGAQVVSSGELITRFHSRWSAEGLASHRRASVVLVEVARAAFARLAAAAGTADEMGEGELRAWVLDQLAARGCGSGADCIVAAGARAADPHYQPEGRGAPLRRGDVVLLDLWSKESERAIYADQTWMAYLGPAVPERVANLWGVVRDARDAAVAFLRERWRARQPVQGYEVDDAARRVIAGRGYGAAFIHRTGHSIDQATHGMGPNMDNLETHELRRLIPGIGFSIEPGIYLPGDIGLRSEINVYIGEHGPEVTTPDPQAEMFALLAE